MTDVRSETWRAYLMAAYKLVADVANAAQQAGDARPEAVDAANNARAAIAHALGEFTDDYDEVEEAFAAGYGRGRAAALDQLESGEPLSADALRELERQPEAQAHWLRRLTVEAPEGPTP